MSLAPGARLGPYEIVASIGAGGMGQVYEARDTRLDRTVAVKILPPVFAHDPQLRQRFDREARTVAALNHPHICVLHDIGEQDGIAFLVMEYLEGETLASRLSRGPLPPDEVIRYGTEIADALDRAHRHGVIHRDLKPANVMLTRSGAKLLDFGLARPPVESIFSSETRAPGDTPITAEGVLGRHAAVHGARAARRTCGGRAHRHLRARRAAVRDVHGRARVSRRRTRRASSPRS